MVDKFHSLASANWLSVITWISIEKNPEAKFKLAEKSMWLALNEGKEAAAFL